MMVTTLKKIIIILKLEMVMKLIFQTIIPPALLEEFEIRINKLGIDLKSFLKTCLGMILF